MTGDRLGDAEGEREPFFDPDKDLDLDLEPDLICFGLGDLDLERDLVWKDLGVPDREREWIDTFGERDRENDLERDRDLETAWGEGDLEDDRKFVLGESHLDETSFGLEFDLDLEREFLDAATELLDEE